MYGMDTYTIVRMKICVVILSVVSTVFSQLTPGVLEVNPGVTGNKYIFTLGGCDDECGCGAGCCDPANLLEAQKDYVDKVAANVGAKSGVTSPLCIGVGVDFQPATIQNCDHMSNATFIYNQPFQYNGDLLSVEFSVHPSCGDTWNTDRGYNTHVLFRIGTFRKSGLAGTCIFALHAYLEFRRTDVDMAAWDAALTAGTSFTFKYTFTAIDLLDLGIKNQQIKDLHIGIQMTDVGTVAYQKWDNAFTGDPMCLGDMGQLDDPAVLNTYQELFPNDKQKNRVYNLCFSYQPW